jgi:hypothetical protein
VGLAVLKLILEWEGEGLWKEGLVGGGYKVGLKQIRDCGVEGGVDNVEIVVIIGIGVE